MFNDAQDFIFVCDNKCFTVTPSAQKVEANKTVSLTVKYTADAQASTTGETDGDGSSSTLFVNSKLFASCPSQSHCHRGCICARKQQIKTKEKA